jgi:hypothetical protein
MEFSPAPRKPTPSTAATSSKPDAITRAIIDLSLSGTYATHMSIPEFRSFSNQGLQLDTRSADPRRPSPNEKKPRTRRGFRQGNHWELGAEGIPRPA